MIQIQQFLVIVTAIFVATVVLYAAVEPEHVKTTVARKGSTPSAIVPPKPKTKLLVAASSRQAPPLPQSTPAHGFIHPTTGMEFLPVPGGCFQMGDISGDSEEKPVHQVCLNSFYIGKFEVTQGEWQRVMGNSPSFFSFCGEDCPVESVSWDDVQTYIAKLNGLNGKTYRLLTEAEWDYACRSGGKNEPFCGSNNLDTMAWYDRNSSSKPHPVGAKRPNGLGIYDMSGNVWEWVNDRFGKDYYSSSTTDNPEGPLSGSRRVIRGGSWYNDSRNVRASIRGSFESDYRSINLGFRLAFSDDKVKAR